MLLVRLSVPSGGMQPEQLVLPFTGMLDAVRARWVHGKELVGMASTLSALVIGAVVLVRRRGQSELRWVIGVQMAFLAVCSGNVLATTSGVPERR